MRRKKWWVAPAPVLEHLENRRLLHGGLSAQINFQPTGIAVPAGYLADTGLAYAGRGNGFTYGWNADNTANTRIRNLKLSPDARYDTLDHMQKDGGDLSWEISVPNGDYTVHVVAGDAKYVDSIYKIDVEGVLTVNGTPTTSHHWIEGTKTVTVNDGRLTISNAAGSSNNRICFVDITAFDDPTVVGIGASTSSVFEDGSARDQFVLTRTGSVSAPLSANYLVGGSATGGNDYDSLSGTATFAAGSDKALINVVPHADSDIEGDETVMLTLSVNAAYQVDPLAGSATTTLIDDDASSADSISYRRVNFQPDGTDVPSNYRADTGASYGLRPNGWTYGWNGNNSGTARDRNSSLSPDQRYDTLIHMQKSGNWKWEIAVPNGTYTVRVVSGDATAFDSIFKINVEGVSTVNGTPSSSAHWIEGTKTVTVSDARLTVSNGIGASNNKIDFIEIAPGSSPLPVVRLAASDASASESGDKGQLRVTRTGSVSSSLVVNYTIGGSATNGSDYQALSGTVTIPASSASANIDITPVNDSSAEASESVVLKLSSSSSYSLASKFSDSVTISDNDTTGTLHWATVKSSPQVRAEATGAVIGGKLYCFGGYKDSTYHPMARVDVYDPATNTWTQKKNMPVEITHAGTTTDGTYAYLAGGYPGDPTKGQTFSTTAVRRYDPSTDSWTSIKSLPSARGAGNLQYLNGKLYFFGGSDSQRKDRAETFSLDLTNPNANWVQLASMPAARNHVGGATLNGFIYSVGGQTGQDNLSVFKGDMWRYDPAANKWTTVASLINQPRSHINGATFALNGRIIACGGEGPGRVALTNVEAYDPSANKWTSLASLPGGRSSGIAGAFSNGKIIFSGGYTGSFRAETWLGTFS